MHTHGADRRRGDETADVDTMFEATVSAVAAAFIQQTQPGQPAQPMPEDEEENEETAQLPETNCMPSAARWGCLWDFRRITRQCGLDGCAKFWSLAFAIAHDPVAEEALKYMLADDRVSMKTKSHQGTVWRQGRGVMTAIGSMLFCGVPLFGKAARSQP